MLNKIIILMLALLLSACSQTYPNQQPLGSSFPKVVGEGLDKQTRQLPDYFSGRPVVLLLGYKQASQFDIDRWLIGLDMTETNVEVFELPTIQGWLPRQIKSTINQGMRKGIPEELWSIVITVYDDGEKLQEYTGNENPNNARLLLLDNTGKVAHFYDRGFSVAELNRLRKSLSKINNTLN